MLVHIQCNRLIFVSVLLDIEVVTYYDDNKLNEYDAMPMDDRRDIPLDGVLKLAAICRQVRDYK